MAPLPTFTAEVPGQPVPTPTPAAGGPPGGVPGVSNGSDVRAVVEAVNKVADKPPTYLLTIRVLGSEDLAGVAGLTEGTVGESLQVTVLREDLGEVQPGAVIEARVQFRRDEWGGGFYAQDVTRLGR